MASKKLISAIAVLMSFVVLFVEFPPIVSCETDITFVETARDDGYDSDAKQKNLQQLLKLFGFLLNGHEDLKPHTVASILRAYERNDLTALIEKLLSTSSNSQEDGGDLTHEKNNEDVFKAPQAKRGEEIYGAMPPLNELCRLMRVQCY